MSESRILVLDNDAVRAERTVALLEFMDFNPRWVSDAADFDLGRQRQNDWMAVIVGSLDDSAASAALYNWLGGSSLPPPVLLADGEATAFAQQHGLHEANIWPLETPLRHTQMEALLRRASLKRLDAEHQAGAVQEQGPTGHGPAVTELRTMIEQVAAFDTTVLVLGESGTGKELVARALHQCSHRCDGPFVAVNCGAIPDTLLEAEFFGVRKGAYTGASAHREGYFQAARGGTLFLDEIGDLPQPMQVKLLRAVQERRVRSLGATDDEATDVRLVSATHLDLERAVAAGRFRQDLYYRLNVIDLHLPPLRERLDDLPELAQALLQRLSERNGNPKPPLLSPAALARLAQHPFPGNVRELENLLERALALHPGPVLDAEAVWTPPPAAPRAGTEANQGHTADFSPTQRPAGGWPADAPDEQAPTREQLLAWLNQHRWNQSRAARQLGWTLAKLRYWMQRHGLSDATSQS